MAYWLLKTEPSTYSFADLVTAKQTRWDGIENPAALKLMRSAVIGECEIVKAAYPDPKSERLVVIDIKAGKALKKPVGLALIKRDPLFADSPLVRQGRLSFVPLTDAQWKRIHELAAL